MKFFVGASQDRFLENLLAIDRPTIPPSPAPRPGPSLSIPKAGASILVLLRRPLRVEVPREPAKTGRHWDRPPLSSKWKCLILPLRIFRGERCRHLGLQ